MPDFHEKTDTHADLGVITLPFVPVRMPDAITGDALKAYQAQRAERKHAILAAKGARWYRYVQERKHWHTLSQKKVYDRERMRMLRAWPVSALQRKAESEAARPLMEAALETCLEVSARAARETTNHAVCFLGYSHDRTIFATVEYHIAAFRPAGPRFADSDPATLVMLAEQSGISVDELLGMGA